MKLVKESKFKIMFGVVLCLIVAGVGFAASNGVFAAQEEIGCGEITEGTPFYELPRGTYTDFKTGEEVMLFEGIASESTIGVSDETVHISPRCRSENEYILVFNNFVFVDTEGTLHSSGSAIGSYTDGTIDPLQ